MAIQLKKRSPVESLLKNSYKDFIVLPLNFCEIISSSSNNSNNKNDAPMTIIDASIW